MRGDRQQQCLPYGQGHAAGGAGDQPACHRRQSENHCQSQLLDHPDGGGAETDSRPLHRIKRVVVSTYQSVSGTGQDAIEELKAQSGQALK